MKKIISLALALVMILSLATVAFAQEVEPTVAVKSGQPSFTVTYDPSSGKAPKEEFEFTITAVTYGDLDSGASADVPTLYVDRADWSDSNVVTNKATKTIKVWTGKDEKGKYVFNISGWTVGKYTYTIREVTPTSDTNKTGKAGVSYDDKTLTLELFIENDENGSKVAKYNVKDSEGKKVEDPSFDNVYKHGKVTVTKKITGENANMDAKFRIKVTLTLPSGKTLEANDGIIEETCWEGGTSWPSFDAEGEREFNADNNDNSYVMFGNDETYTFSNLPVGTTVEVEEVNTAGYASIDGYTVTYKVDNGTASKEKVADATVNAGKTTAVVVTNNLSGKVDTGVVLDSMPYILLLTLAAAGMFLLLTKKRAREF